MHACVYAKYTCLHRQKEFSKVLHEALMKDALEADKGALVKWQEASRWCLTDVYLLRNDYSHVPQLPHSFFNLHSTLL